MLPETLISRPTSSTARSRARTDQPHRMPLRRHAAKPQLSDLHVTRLGPEQGNKSFQADDYYKLIFLAEGAGTHWIDDARLQISAPEYYFLEPGQVHRWRFTEPPKGYAVFFKPSFYNDVKEMISVNLYHQVFRLTRLCLPKGHRTESFVQEICWEYEHPTGHSVHVIHGLLRALYGRLLRISKSDCAEQASPLSLFNRFEELLVEEGYKIHKVKDLAARLNCTPQHLNTLCRLYAHRSASELIVAHVLLEAKRLLLHTDNTIQEIALFLSFEDASHLIKFFKRHVGLTPRQYRMTKIQ